MTYFKEKQNTQTVAYVNYFDQKVSSKYEAIVVLQQLPAALLDSDHMGYIARTDFPSDYSSPPSLKHVTKLR